MIRIYKSGVMIFILLLLPVSYANTLNLIYDGNGNLVTGDSFYREYNGFNQLIVVREGNTSDGPILQEYTWHPVEERILIKKVYEDEEWKETVYYVSDEYVHIKNASGNYSETYVYQNGQMVAQEINGVKKALHPDHLGSTSLVTDSNGNVVEDNFYSPYGEQIEFGNSRFGYEGKEFDSQTQDTDFHFRKYKPEWGRFTQPDTLIPQTFNPQALNRYAFVYNNPYTYIDPTGRAGTRTPFGERIQQAAQGFNDWVDARYQEVADLAKEVWDSVPGSEYISNFLSTSDAGTAKDVSSYAQYKQGSIVFGERFFSEEELKRRGDRAVGSMGDSILNRIFGKLIPGFGFGSTAYGTYTGDSLIRRSSGYASSIIQSIISSGSSAPIFGPGGGSGYSGVIGAYVTESGRVYPTNNPNWKPKEERDDNSDGNGDGGGSGGGGCKSFGTGKCPRES